MGFTSLLFYFSEVFRHAALNTMYAGKQVPLVFSSYCASAPSYLEMNSTFCLTLNSFSRKSCGSSLPCVELVNFILSSVADFFSQWDLKIFRNDDSDRFSCPSRQHLKGKRGEIAPLIPSIMPASLQDLRSPASICLTQLTNESLVGLSDISPLISKSLVHNGVCLCLDSTVGMAPDFVPTVCLFLNILRLNLSRR